MIKMAKNKKDDINSFEGLFNGQEKEKTEQTQEREQLKGQMKIADKDMNIEEEKENEKGAENTQNTENTVSADNTEKKQRTKQRVNFSIFPDIYEDMRKIADMRRISFSQLAEECFNECISKSENQKLIELCNQIEEMRKNI